MKLGWHLSYSLDSAVYVCKGTVHHTYMVPRKLLLYFPASCASRLLCLHSSAACLCGLDLLEHVTVVLAAAALLLIYTDVTCLSLQGGASWCAWQPCLPPQQWSGGACTSSGKGTSWPLQLRPL